MLNNNYLSAIKCQSTHVYVITFECVDFDGRKVDSQVTLETLHRLSPAQFDVVLEQYTSLAKSTPYKHVRATDVKCL